jgi:hypothetical protein
MADMARSMPGVVGPADRSKGPCAKGLGQLILLGEQGENPGQSVHRTAP